MIEYIQNTAQKPATNGARQPDGGTGNNPNTVGLAEEDGTFAGALMSVIRRIAGFQKGSGENPSGSDAVQMTEAGLEEAQGQQNTAPLNLPGELKLLNGEDLKPGYAVSASESMNDETAQSGLLSKPDMADLSELKNNSRVLHEFISQSSEQKPNNFTAKGEVSPIEKALAEAARSIAGLEAADSAEMGSAEVRNSAFVFSGSTEQLNGGALINTENAPSNTPEAVKTISSVLSKDFQVEMSELSARQSAAPDDTSDGKSRGESTLVKELERAAQSLSARRSDVFQPVQENSSVVQHSKTVSPDIFKEVAKATGINTGELQRPADAKTAEQGFEAIVSTPRPDLSQRSEADVQLVRKIQQVVKQEIQPNLTADKAWKLHNFSLHDGSRVQLAFRQLEGVLQLQLSSINQDLNRLIQMNVQEIRDYLQNEMGLDIDLQFDENRFSSGEEMNNDESSGSGNTQAGSSENRPSSRFLAKEAVAGRARFFGFNDNEWTA